MKDILAQLAALTIIMGDTSTTRHKEVIQKIAITEKPPGNSKEYWFNESGKFSTEKMLKTDVVFSCYAVNDKNAIRKFNNWKTTNHGRI